MIPKHIEEVVNIPINIKHQIQSITFHKYESKENINEWLANLFIQEEFIEKVFNKKFGKHDWEKLYYSIQNSLKTPNNINNGILAEHLSSYFLSKKLSLKSLLTFTDLNFEQPSNGIDIIFLNNSNGLELFEIKSSIKNDGKKYEKTSFITSSTMAAINSLFFTKIKNVSKLVNAKGVVEKDGLMEVFEVLSDILRDGSSNMIKYVEHDKMSFNICLFGKEIDFDKKFFEMKIVELLTGEDKNPLLAKVKIIKLISLQFKGDLSIYKLLTKIMDKAKSIGEFI